jgi:hypothetical protein
MFFLPAFYDIAVGIAYEVLKSHIPPIDIIWRAVNVMIRKILHDDERRRILGRHADLDPKKLDLLTSPLVAWSPAEEQFAHQVIQKHFDEDG